MISFILPVYNCYDALMKGLPSLINILSSLASPYEIIIVDDGSTERKDLHKIINEHCTILYNEKNYGKGHAVKRGVLQSSGDYIIFMDGDFPFDLWVIESACNQIKMPGVDIIIGDRSLSHSSDEHTGFIRSLGSSTLSFLMKKIFANRFDDTQCGIKGFTKDVAKDLFQVSTLKGFSFDVEILYIAVKRNYSIKKIPVKVNKQLSSSVVIILHGIEMITSLFKIKLNYISGKYNKQSAKI